jgi:thiol-disulfide isomerase/thioredoxin
MDKFVNFNSSPATNNSFMSTIQSAGSKMGTTTILLIVASILFISIACAYYYFYIVPSSNAMYRANNELNTQSSNGGNGSKEAEILFFHAEWCPHCKTAKPVWESLKSQYENKTINGYKVIFTEINCTTENAEVEKMMDKYNVEGFPTIKLLKDGQIIEYDAKPTRETLDQFLNTVLN